MSSPTYRVDIHFVGGATLTLSTHETQELALEAIRKQYNFLKAEHVANRSGYVFSATIRNDKTISVTRDDARRLHNSTGLYCVFNIVETQNNGTPTTESEQLR